MVNGLSSRDSGIFARRLGAPRAPLSNVRRLETSSSVHRGVFVAKQVDFGFA